YGLKVAAISSHKLPDANEGHLTNKDLYNDKELIDEADLNWYDYGFRYYDPQIGRFPQLDPLTDGYPELTPYQYASCEPIANIDLDGLEKADALKAAGRVFTDQTAIVTANTFLSDIVIKALPKAAKTGGFWAKVANYAVKAGDILTDALPFIGSGKDIYNGIKDGDGLQIAMGVGGLILDIFTLGTASVVKGVVKGGVKILAREGTETIVKQEAKQVARQSTQKFVKEETQQVTKKILKNPPCGCFVAGTLVLTDSGYTKIEKIKPGDVVWAYNDTTHVYDKKKVANIFEYVRDTVYQIRIGEEVISATSDHPFFAGGRWLRVAQLKVGDSVVSYSGGKIAISTIEIIANRTTVHNFEVEGYHTYYVSKQHVLVHNSGPCPLKSKTHGNKLDNKPAEGYSLKDRSTGEVQKFGETTRGERKFGSGNQKRYSKKYLKENNLDYVKETQGGKKTMHKWQNKKITDYKSNNGKRPRLNKSDY
ncbi:MAG: polymorphic toxin-type HINT domain-containing protein, partial [Chitinophagaceae bacterium]|nr:polymorphic toxin-type HINT domain-containing protein [Chitinophagaceae bacterium]